MRTAGFVSLYLSLESTDQDLMRQRGPKASPADLESALLALEAAGFERRSIAVYLIIGLPGQSLTAVAESVAFVRGLGAAPRAAYFSPIPGTAEWAGLVRSGVLADDGDPLLHNKTAFAYLRSGVPPDAFGSLMRAQA
jgi:hypothetical protein